MALTSLTSARRVGVKPEKLGVPLSDAALHLPGLGYACGMGAGVGLELCPHPDTYIRV